MIKPNDLRIGNVLLYEATYHIVYCPGPEYVDHYWHKTINPRDDSYTTKYSEISPVPLSPELLEKCGFTLHPWGWVRLSSTDFGVRLQVKSFSYEVSGNNPIRLAYLHQLQNLYFALTGEELPITL